MTEKRRFAANRVIFGNTTIVNGVVEVEGHNVVGLYEFKKEPARTEWVGGTIVVVNTDGTLVAYKDDNILNSRY